MSIAAALILSGAFLTQSAPASESVEAESAPGTAEAPAVRENAAEALSSAQAGEGGGGSLEEVSQAGEAASAGFAAAREAENAQAGGPSQVEAARPKGRPADQIQARGALLAPLERGGLSYYGTFGYPELKAGFREGMNGFELGAELGFDYTLTDLWLVALGRGSVWRDDRRDWSLEGQLGAFGSFGAKGIESRNRPGQGIRLGLGCSFTHSFELPLLFTATGKIPLEIPLSSTGLLRFGLLLGAGIELPLTEVFVVSLSFDVGPMLWHQYGGVSYFKLGYDVAVGLGFRLF